MKRRGDSCWYTAHHTCSHIYCVPTLELFSRPLTAGPVQGDQWPVWAWMLPVLTQLRTPVPYCVWQMDQCTGTAPLHTVQHDKQMENSTTVTAMFIVNLSNAWERLVCTKYLLIILSNNWRRHNKMCVCRYHCLVWTTCVLMFVNLDWIRAESWRADLNCIINTFTRGCRVPGSNVEESCRLRPQ